MWHKWKMKNVCEIGNMPEYSAFCKVFPCPVNCPVHLQGSYGKDVLRRMSNRAEDEGICKWFVN